MDVVCVCLLSGWVFFFLLFIFFWRKLALSARDMRYDSSFSKTWTFFFFISCSLCVFAINSIFSHVMSSRTKIERKKPTRGKSQEVKNSKYLICAICFSSKRSCFSLLWPLVCVWVTRNNNMKKRNKNKQAHTAIAPKTNGWRIRNKKTRSLFLSGLFLFQFLSLPVASLERSLSCTNSCAP